MNIPEQLQQTLNYPALQVIDATTGLPENATVFDELRQSVLITFLAGLYKATRTTEGAFLISSQDTATALLSSIFVNEGDIAEKIALHTNQTVDTVKTKLEEVATGFLSIDEYKNDVDGIKTSGLSFSQWLDYKKFQATDFYLKNSNYYLGF